jgi:hypothetical protein
MSDRGSFCTQYVYCDKCFDELCKHLIDNQKYLCSTIIPPWGDDNEVPIIAGKIGGLGAGDIDLFFEFVLADKLKNKLCCDISISASDDNGEWTVYNYEGKDNE